MTGNRTGTPIDYLHSGVRFVADEERSCRDDV
jgi:hypothetical protein